MLIGGLLKMTVHRPGRTITVQREQTARRVSAKLGIAVAAARRK
jgi:hypothetical protein